MDQARRALGETCDLCGLTEGRLPFRIVKEFRGAKLRAYHPVRAPTAPVVLIIPAPFKSAAIWDLAPPVSVVRQFLGRGFQTFLLEWITPSENEDDLGLADYAHGLPAAALETISRESSNRPFLVGHSLGGTFAAICTCMQPQRVSGVILVDAPLAFAEQGGPLAKAVKASPPAQVIRAFSGSPVPGSVIGALSTAAAPEAFQLQRVFDLFASAGDLRALDIHARVERWALDEFPLTGRLFEDTIEQLYRNDHFMRNRLQVGERMIGIKDLASPTLAIINHVGKVVPPRSLLDALHVSRSSSLQVLEYSGDRGPMFQHLGPLVAPVSHETIWPKILDWITTIAMSIEPPLAARRS